MTAFPKKKGNDRQRTLSTCVLENLHIADVKISANHIHVVRPEPIFDKSEYFDIAYHGYEGDSSFYLEKAKGNNILYLGAGTGRIFNEVWRSNPTLIGVDKSKSMISSLLRKNPCLKHDQIIEGDILELEFQEEYFDTIIAPYSFFAFFDPDNIDKLLNKICRWLKPQGSFFTDIFSPFTNPPFNINTELERSWINGKLSCKIFISYDHFNQNLTEVACVHNGKTHHDYEMNMFFYYPNELNRFIKENDLEVEEMWGDFINKTVPTIASEVFVYHIKKPQLLNNEAF